VHGLGAFAGLGLVGSAMANVAGQAVGAGLFLHALHRERAAAPGDDPVALVRAAARQSRLTKERAGDLMVIIRQAAGTEPALAELWEKIETEFRAVLGGFAERLASLTFDSALEPVRGLRSGSGQPRVLIFTAARLSLELEVMADLVVGQIVPPGPGEVVVETPDGTTVRVEADDIGLFDFAGLPRGQIRLRCQTPDGNLVTDWMCL